MNRTDNSVKITAIIVLGFIVLAFIGIYAYSKFGGAKNTYNF
jgi:hypothetical protein